MHVVDEAFLSQFEPGAPIHVLLKCDGSPHIYRMERDAKRWIKDIATFEAEGHVWDDVRFVDCDYLDASPTARPSPRMRARRLSHSRANALATCVARALLFLPEAA